MAPMTYVAPGIDNDKLAMLLANPARAAQLAQIGQTFQVPGTYVDPQATAQAVAAVPDVSGRKWEGGLAPTPVPTADPNASYAQPAADIDPSKPSAQRVMAYARPDAAAPTASSVGATPELPSVLRPNLAKDSLNGLIRVQPQFDTSAEDKLKQDEAKRVAVMNDPNNRARWYDRLGAALAAGAMNWGGHNPEGALATARAINDRRYSQALQPIDASIEADRAAIQQNQQDFENRNRTWEQGLRSVAAQGLQSEREAKAQKLENAVDPNTIRQNRDGDWVGTTYSGQTVAVKDPTAGKEDAEAKEAGRVAAREKVALRMGLKRGSPEFNAYVLGGGQGFIKNEYPNPGHTMSREEQLHAAFVRENHREPTVAEAKELYAGSGGAYGNSAASEGLTAAETRTFKSRTERYEDQKNALLKEQALYAGATDDQSKAASAAIDQKLDGIYKAIDAEREKIISARTSKTKQPAAASSEPSAPAVAGPAPTPTAAPKAWSVPSDAPPAPKQDGHQLAKDGKVIAVSKGGKWVKP